MTVAMPGRVSVLSHPDGVAIVSAPTDPRLADAAAAGVGFVATLVMATIATATDLGHHPGTAAFAMTAVTAFSAWWGRPRMGAVAALLGFLMFNGFVVDAAGSLHWHGASDGWRLLAFAGVGLSVSGARAVWLDMTKRVLIEDLTYRPGVEAELDTAQGEHHA
jgi:hypothetical protein